MLEIAHQSSTRIVGKGLLGLGAVVLALLCTLVLATGARAEATSSTPAPVSGLGGGLETPAAPTSPVTSPQAPLETTTPVTIPEVTGESTTPVTTELPAETTLPVTTENSTSPVTTETTLPVTTETTLPVTTESPLEPTTPEVKPPEVTTTEAVTEVAAPVTTTEGTPGDTSSALAGSLLTQDAAAHPEVAGEPAAEPVQETAGASSGSQLFFATTSGTAGGPPSADAGMASAGAPAVLVAARLTKELSCGLSALGGREPQSCAGGWLSTQRLFSGSPVGGVVALAAASMIAATGGAPPSHGVHGGSAVGSAPVGPAPPSAPGGASGSAAGAPGLGISSILTLAGLLLLAAPRAMRRLRLSCRPWLTACFVLIPERPG